MPDEADDMSWILERVDAGDASTEELLSRVYAELRSTAGRLMQRERMHHTLQPTALVHEAFVRLAESPSASSQDRLEFLAAAACAMRRVLVDHARGRGAEKRGGAWKRVTLQGIAEGDTAEDELDLVALHDALETLAELDPRQARIVELRFFSGMSGQEIADHLEVSRNTVVRELALARAWLQRERSRSG